MHMLSILVPRSLLYSLFISRKTSEFSRWSQITWPKASGSRIIFLERVEKVEVEKVINNERKIKRRWRER